jgi:hypothetical protein
LEARRLSATKWGLYTPGRGRKRPGIVGSFVCKSAFWDSAESDAYIRKPAGNTYPDVEPKWDDDDDGVWLTDPPATGSSPELEVVELDDPSEDPFGVEIRETRESKWRDPSSVHADQRGLDAFSGGDDDGDSTIVEVTDPCSYDEIRSCDCCRCICGARSIRERKTKSPTYACGHPDCSREFESPVRPRGK